MEEESPIQKLKKRLQENNKSLNISRIPDKTKENFIVLANEEFCGDYGMVLKEILDCYFEHHAMKSLFFQNIDMKLDHIIGEMSKNEKKEEKPETKSLRMLSGKRIELKGGEK